MVTSLFYVPAHPATIIGEKGLNDDNLLSPCVSGEVLSLEIAFYRTRRAAALWLILEGNVPSPGFPYPGT
jgi:hypothetical protein